jgi:glutathione S-transferase
MNIRASHPGKGMSPAVQKDIDRIVAIWQDCRAHAQGGAEAEADRAGPMLFGDFGVADAMFAPVVTRFMTYATALPPAAQAYADAVLGLSAVRAWLEEARGETGFVRADEPYA